MITKHSGKPSSSLPIDQKFYKKSLEPFCGLYVLSSDQVSNDSLIRAVQLLDQMFKFLPLSVLQNLYDMYFRVNIIGEHEKLTDMPEWRHMAGKKNKENREMDELRGYSNSNVWIAEDELLHLESSKYPKDQELFVHEVAHVIMDYGVDDNLRRMIEQQFEQSVNNKGLWRGAYAATNKKEYFAELSMWYFGFRGNIPDLSSVDPFLDSDTFPQRGREALKNYDEEGHNLLELIYSGNQTIQVNYPMSRISKETASPIKCYSLEESRKLLPDKNVATKSYLVFTNSTMETLSVYWIDYNSERQFMVEIEPFRTYIQASFETHPFSVYVNSSEVEQFVGVYVVEKESRHVVISQESLTKSKRSETRRTPEIYFSLYGALPFSKAFRGVSIL